MKRLLSPFISLTLAMDLFAQSWGYSLQPPPGGGGGDMLGANNLSDVASAVTSRTNLGATTVGANIFSLTNPGAITFLKIAANNTVSTRSASQMVTDLGATTVGSNLFGLTNPSAISFLQVNADNSVTAQNAAAQRTAIGATTVGANIFTLTNPGAISFPKIAADNSVSAESAATHRTSLGLAIGTNVEAWDTDLDTWAGVTPGTGVATALATAKDASGGFATIGGGAIGYELRGAITANFAPADSTTYFVGTGYALSAAQRTTYANAQMTIPKAGTIKIVEFQIFTGTNGTNESVTHAIRKNNTTDTTLSSSETWDPGASTVKLFRYTGQNISVAAGDTIAFKIVSPAWATNPTSSSCELLVWIEF